MELVEKTDEEGNTYTYKRYQGRPFHKEVPGNVEDQLKKVAEFQARPDDVYVCSFPKSGTHWMMNIVNMLRTGSVEYTGNAVFLEFHDISTTEKLKPPRLIFSHLTYPFLPTSVKGGTGKVINVVRNPKDSFVSFWTFMGTMFNTGYEGNMAGFLRYFLSEEFFTEGASWFTYIKEWTDGKATNPDMQVITVWYEDLKKDLHGEITRIAKFLAVNCDESFLREVEKNVSFEKLKHGHDTKSGETDRWKVVCKEGRLPIYRKGMVGDWKNHLTVAQNELFDAVIKEKLQGYDFDLKYE